LNKAIFFDRDGVLNELVKRDGGFYSPQSFDQFIVLGAAENVINKLKERGFLCIVVSNQPDISRGYLKQTELDKMTKILFDKLLIDDVLYCVHDNNDACNCRKPAPGLLTRAAKKWNINLDKSYMIGDTWKDAEAAKSANVKYFLLNRDYNLDYNSSNRLNSLEEIFKYI